MNTTRAFNSSKGNISVQIKKLNDAGLIRVKKQFKENYPCPH